MGISKKYFTLAEEFRKNNQYKESIENYLNSILIDRENSDSYIGLALSYKNLKNYKKAISTLKKAEKIKPNNVGKSKIEQTNLSLTLRPEVELEIKEKEYARGHNQNIISEGKQNQKYQHNIHPHSD